MVQWNAEQLANVAGSALANGKHQDAVNVLGYLIQNHPDSDEAQKARLTYHDLTGTMFPETGQKALPPAKNGSAQIDNEKKDAPVRSDGHPGGAAPRTGALPQTAKGAREGGTAAPSSRDGNLQSDDWIGRGIADLFYVLGMALLPSGALMLIFVIAFEFLLIYGLIAIVFALAFLALGQSMWAVFENRRLHMRALDELQAAKGQRTPSTSL